MIMNSRYILLIAFMVIANLSFSQCDEVARSSEQYFDKDFISDGQTYRALLYDDQVAEFSTLFFGGSTYRLSANTGTDKGIVFRVLDKNRNVIFSSSVLDVLKGNVSKKFLAGLVLVVLISVVPIIYRKLGKK